MKKIRRISLYIMFFGLILVLCGGTYAFFEYHSTSNQMVSYAGNISMKVTQLSSNNIVFNRAFPESYHSALFANGATLRTDNIIEFTVTGANNYNNPLYYGISLKYADDVNGKTRIKDKCLKFELLDITDNLNPIVLLSDVNYEEIDDKLIHSEIINTNVTNFSKTYRLRVWIDEYTIISDTNPQADYSATTSTTKTTFKDVFASVKVKVFGDLIIKEVGTSDTCFSYTLSGNNALVNGYNNVCGENVEIPKTINNYNVTGIADNAFKNNSTITKVTIPEGVTSIGSNAFSGCSNLYAISLPSTLLTLGTYSFNNCTNLLSIDLPTNLTTIGSYSFKDCRAIKNITFPNSLDIIGDHAFFNCVNLISIYIPSNVNSVGSYAFSYCENLQTANVQANIYGTSYGMFSCCYKLKSVTLKNSYKRIDTDTFYRNYNLVHINLPTSLENIGQLAFDGCQSLKELIIPNSVTTIDSYAFQNCTSLTKIVLPNNLHGLEHNLFSNCESLKSVTIPDTVTDISYEVFYNTGITELYIPASVENFNWEYEFIPFLEKIVVDPNNPVYDSRNNCNCLIDTENNAIIKGSSNSVIPDGITTINNFAFIGIRGLKSIVLPEGLSYIGNYSFSQTGLSSIYIPSSVTYIGDSVFFDTHIIEATICCEIDSETYGWFIDEMYDLKRLDLRTSDISMIDFCNLYNLESISLYCEYIPDHAFDAALYSLKNIDLHGTTEIGECAFLSTSITDLYLPDTLEIIGSQAFAANDCLNTIHIPSSVNFIGEDAFSYCASINDVYVEWENFNTLTIEGEIFYHGDRHEATTLHVPVGKVDLYIDSVDIIPEFELYTDGIISKSITY